MSKIQAAAVEDNDHAFFKSLDIFAGSAEAIKRWLIFNIERDQPCGLFGRAGIGKTQLVRQVADLLEMDLITFYLHHMEREDLGGFPFPDPADPHGVVMRLKRQIPKQRSKKKGTILFLDEFNRCERPVLTAAFTIMEKPRILGDFELPDDVRIVLSGNPSDTMYSVNEAEKEPAIRRRVCWAGMLVNHAAWLKHATEKKFHLSVINYIRRHKRELYDMEAHNAGKVGANPASWEKVSQAVQDAERVSGGDFRQVDVELRISLSGLIGMRLMTDFMSELVNEDLAIVEPEAILHAPDGFLPGSETYEQVKRIAHSKKQGGTGDINKLCTALAITVAMTQPPPSSVAGPIARFAKLLEGDTLQKFLVELLKTIQEQDEKKNYLPLLNKQLAEQPEYREVMTKNSARAAAVQDKINRG